MSVHLSPQAPSASRQPAPAPTLVAIPSVPIPVSNPGEPCSGQTPGICSVQINFDTASFTILQQETAKLDTIGREMLGAAPTSIFVIDGYTDTVGSGVYNQVLPMNRAKSVAEYLKKRFPVLTPRIITRGFGKQNQMVPTADQVAEPRNRRVAFAVIAATPQVPTAR